MRFLLFIYFFLIFLTSNNSQDVNNLSVKNGLLSNHIYDIDQDSDGFMWFATNQGLVKFDGINLKTFTLKNGLPSNDTWYIEADDKQRIWYVSKNKHQGYIKKDSLYRFITEDSKMLNPRTYFYYNNRVHFVEYYSVPTDKFSFKTLYSDKISNYFEYEYSSFKVEKSIKKLKSSTHDNYFYDLELKNIITYDNNKFQLLDDNNNKLLEISLELKIQNEKPKKIRSDNNYRKINKHLYLFYFQTGICFLDLKDKKTIFYSYKELIGENYKGLSRMKINPLGIQLSLSNYLILFDHHLKPKKTYHFPQKDIDNRPYMDRDGNVWLANFIHGITMIPNEELEKKHYFKNHKVSKLAVLDHKLFVGVENNGFYVKTNSDFTKIGIPKGSIYIIKQIQQEYHLVSAQTSYISNFNRPIKASVNNYIDTMLTNERLAYKNLIHTKEQIHLISHSEYIVLNKKTKQIISRQALVGAYHLSFHQNKIFIGGSDGLQIRQDGVIKKPSIQHQILNIPVSDLYSHHKQLFVGTDGQGVYVYEKDKITAIRSTTNLSVQKIIIQDNYMWLATQDGVKKIALNHQNIGASKIIDAFYKEDGILQNNTNDIALLHDTLYVATDMGLSFINLNNKNLNKRLQIYFNTTNDTIHYHNNNTPQISVSYGVVDYVRQKRISYSYRLLPDQRQWSKTKNTSLNFSNLDQGMHILEIKTTDHHQNQAIKQLFIHITPSWYQTHTARITFILIGLLLFFTIYKIVYNYIQKQQILKTQQEKRVLNLELQALRSQMNPHFIHNSLNAILYYIQRNEVVLSEKYLLKFYNLVEHFFDYSKDQNISLEEEILFLRTYLEMEQLRFEEKLTFTIHIDKKLDPKLEYIPVMLLQPLVENAVNHGLFHKHGKGLVQIRIKYINNNSFGVEIEDNGIGIDKSKQLFKTSNKNYKSTSSDVLKERLALLKEANYWNIKHSIIDLSNNGTDTGTIISLIFYKSKSSSN